MTMVVRRRLHSGAVIELHRLDDDAGASRHLVILAADMTVATILAGDELESLGRALLWASFQDDAPALRVVEDHSTHSPKHIRRRRS